MQTVGCPNRPGKRAVFLAGPSLRPAQLLSGPISSPPVLFRELIFAPVDVVDELLQLALRIAVVLGRPAQHFPDELGLMQSTAPACRSGHAGFTIAAARVQCLIIVVERPLIDRRLWLHSPSAGDFIERFIAKRRFRLVAHQRFPDRRMKYRRTTVSAAREIGKLRSLRSPPLTARRWPKPAPRPKELTSRSLPIQANDFSLYSLAASCWRMDRRHTQPDRD